MFSVNKNSCQRFLALTRTYSYVNVRFQTVRHRTFIVLYRWLSYFCKPLRRINFLANLRHEEMRSPACQACAHATRKKFFLVSYGMISLVGEGLQEQHRVESTLRLCVVRRRTLAYFWCPISDTFKRKRQFTHGRTTCISCRHGVCFPESIILALRAARGQHASRHDAASPSGGHLEGVLHRRSGDTRPRGCASIDQ